jgi:tRNA-dihydrouridine synthase C
MQGLVDPRMRELLTSIGGIDYCVSEFIRVSGAPVEPHVILRECPELHSHARTAAGTPLHVQLLGSDCIALAQTAVRCVELGAEVIDLNFGCPVKRVNSHDGGAALLRQPGRLQRIACAVREALPAHVPLSAKVRAGWDSVSHVAEIVQAVEAAGCSWVTVHGRTKVQAYEGKADWNAIAAARQAVKIPVVANGDIASEQDLLRCRAVTGCERFMIGRGAVAHPDLFSRLKGIRKGAMVFEEKRALLVRFLRMMLEAGAQKEIMIVGRMKGFCLSMARVDPSVNRLFFQMKRLDRVAAIEQLLRDFRLEDVQEQPAS